MKAASRKKYGLPRALSIVEIDAPLPKDNEVLVRVYAATVNRTDCAILSGRPFIIRLFTGLFRPKRHITGTDFAGEIVAIGKNVTAFAIGNKVWGFNDNGLQSHAQYLTISQNNAVLTMPQNCNYPQAAASAEAAHYAFNFINKVTIKPGDSVLVNGATGGIGTAILQFSKFYGASVTAVCNTKNIELIKSLGADRIINYETEDFTNDNQKYHFVFDAVGKSSFAKCKPILHEQGIYISSELGEGNQNVFLALYTPFLGGKKTIFPIPTNILRSLKFIKKLFEDKQFTPVIDKVYPLDKIAEAFEYVALGQKTGNVVIDI